MGNLIHRQILQLKFASQEDARRWSPRFSELNQQIVLSELDRAFSELAKDQTLRIERLEIDLGSLRPTDLETDLTRAVRQKVREALQPYLQAPQDFAADGSAAHRQSPADDQSGSVEPEIDADSLIELFAYFLQAGHCPWWLQRELVPQLDMLYQRLWRLAPEAARSLILQAIAGPVGLMRLVEQFSNRSHQLTLQELLPPVSGTLLVDLCKLATHLLARQGFGLQARVISLKLAYSLILTSKQQQLERPQSLVRQFFFVLAQISGIPVAQLREELDGAVARFRISSATKTVLAELLRESESLNGQQESARRHGEVSVLERNEQQKRSAVTVEAVEIVIENAGLVLFWPHLKELLDKLELLETRNGGSLRPKVEAVLLLQQLATGLPSGQESLLVLNKVLCGLPPSLPVPRRCRRTRLWDAEVAALLAAVIKQWSALKNTSIDGLRSSFLQREGILREQGQGWTLQVERKAHDILLEQLPWGLGMIQLSWMRQPLQIEW